MPDIRLSVNIRIDPATPTRQLYRVLHDIELGPLTRTNTPEVTVPPLNGERTPFGEAWQRLSFAMNPGMDPLKWTSLYMAHRAFNNNTGFPQRAGDEPKANYIIPRDLGYPDPAWDKTRACGGSTLVGEEVGNLLKVEILYGDGPAPDLAFMRDHPWLWFHATNVDADGTISAFAQNGGKPCLVPLVGSGVATIELYRVTKVDWIADPYYLGSRPTPYLNLF